MNDDEDDIVVALSRTNDGGGIIAAENASFRDRSIALFVTQHTCVVRRRIFILCEFFRFGWMVPVPSKNLESGVCGEESDRSIRANARTIRTNVCLIYF